MFTSEREMRTIVALSLLTQPRKESLTTRDLVQPTFLLVRNWMSTSHAVWSILALAIVNNGAYGRGR